MCGRVSMQKRKLDELKGGPDAYIKKKHIQGSLWLKFENFLKKVIQHSEANSLFKFRLRGMRFVSICSEISCLYYYDQTFGYQANCKKKSMEKCNIIWNFWFFIVLKLIPSSVFDLETWGLFYFIQFYKLVRSDDMLSRSLYKNSWENV